MYKAEFPDYDDELYIPNGFVDDSWHNDTCPKVRKLDGETEFLIWQDYKDPSLRESGGGKRYAFQIIRNETDVVFAYETDDLAMIKEVVK